MAFNPLRTPIDSVMIAGALSPGIAKIIGAAQRRKVDVRGAYGISATIAVWVEIAEFKIEIRLYTDEDWELWHAWSTAVVKPIRRNRRHNARDFALDIWHPYLESLDIKAVVIRSVSQPVEEDGGVFCITLELVEYRRAKMTLSKPEAAKAKPKDAIDRYIDQRAADLKALNEQLADG